MTKTDRYNFDDKDYFPERIFLQGKCDEIVAKIAKDCAWDDELTEKLKSCKTELADDLIKRMEGISFEEKKEQPKDAISESTNNTE